MTRNRTRSKNASHDRIVATGARVTRRSGYGGVSIADIMKEASLTHGGFYAHFPSREATLVELSDRAGADAIAIFARIAHEAPPARSLQALLSAYLCEEQVRQPEVGCPIAALGTEMPRQAPPIRRAVTRAQPSAGDHRDESCVTALSERPGAAVHSPRIPTATNAPRHPYLAPPRQRKKT
jgi:TetR/AcrR family transcriptional regulator, transcriptional repressor for nem operon